MALISKASLLMVPSTYEPGKLYNVLPSGNRAPDNKGGAGYDQTRADFDFDRGSNAAATRINSSGLIEKYRENKLLQSNNFGTTWTTSDLSVTSGQSGYDGTNNAWLLNSSVSGGYLRQNLSGVIGVNTYSFYVKAGSVDWVKSTGFGNTYFDLSGSGSVGTTPTIANIESVGGGWFRCSVTGSTSPSQVRIYPASGDGVDASGSILIQSAQAESGLVATDYLNSTSVTAKAGVLIDLPRINYDANGENGALLLEPSRQQLLQFSEYFGDSYWTKSGASVVGGFTSPEGLSNAYKLVEDTSTGDKNIFTSSISITNSTSYSIHHYIKAGEKEIVGIQDVINSQYWASIDLINGVVLDEKTSGSTKVEPLINGYYKVSYPFISNTTSIRPSIFLLPDSYTTGRPSDQDYTGDGTSGVYIFGAMLEAGSYSTSYIPNHGESGGVTRAADSCSVTGASDVIGQTEGTLYGEINPFQSTGASIISISDGTNDNRILFSVNTDNKYSMFVQATTVQLNLETSGGFSLGAYHKFALRYSENDFKLFVDGSLQLSSTSGSVPSNLSEVEFYNPSGSAGFYGDTKELIVFPTALTDSELATLTTL